MSLGYFVDIQGTLLSDEDKSPIKGALELIEHFNANHIPYMLVTNNTKEISSELMEFLHVKGFNFSHNNFIDPLMVLRDMVGEQKVQPFGSEEFCEVLPKLGFNVVHENADAILVASGYKFTSVDFASMIEAVLEGSKPIGMHATSTYAKKGRRFPGVGAIMAMIEYATGVKCDIVGKPSATFYKKALEALKKESPSLTLNDITMISDDGIGDLSGAKDLGIKTNLVLSGKCKNIKEIKSIEDKIDKVYKSVNEILGEITCNKT